MKKPINEIKKVEFITTDNVDPIVENSEIINEKIPLNFPAIIVSIFTKVIAELLMLNFATIIPPYVMTVFEFTSEETVRLIAPLMGAVGLITIAFSVAYMFFKLGKK